MARRSASVDAAVVGAGSAALGGLVLFPFGLGPVGAILAGANGVLSGWRGIYDWRRAPGWAGAALDATWGLVDVTAARGDALKPPVIPATSPSSAAGRDGTCTATASRPASGSPSPSAIPLNNARDIDDESRRKLIERHEGLHVWQQRWFGPLFPLVYGLWMIAASHRSARTRCSSVIGKRGRSSSNATCTTTTPSSTGLTRQMTRGHPARMTRLIAEGRKPA